MARPDSWFRLYNSTVDNPKVQRLPAALFKVWINLLCVASRHGGRLPPLADVAFILRVKAAQADGWIATLESCGLFVRGADGVLAPHNWDSLQYKSDISTARVQRLRERTKQQTLEMDETVSETLPTTPPATSPEQSSPQQTKTESPQSPPGGGGAEENDEELGEEGFSAAFLKFWEAYPEKVGRRAAWRAWTNAEGLPPLPELLAAVDRYVRTKPSDRVWCNPSTWLRQGRWADVRAAEVQGEAARRADTRHGPMYHGRTVDKWHWGVRMFVERKYWPPSYGPKPGEDGCLCPRAVLAAFNIAPPLSQKPSSQKGTTP